MALMTNPILIMKEWYIFDKSKHKEIGCSLSYF